MLPVLCWGCRAHRGWNWKDYNFVLWRLLRLSKTKLDGWKGSRTAHHPLRNLGEEAEWGGWCQGWKQRRIFYPGVNSCCLLCPGSGSWEDPPASRTQLTVKADVDWGEPGCRAWGADLNQLHPELQHEEPLRHPLPVLEGWTRAGGPRLSKGRFR